MTPVLAIVRNVVRASLRNRTALFFTIGLAVFFMLIFGYLFGGNSSSLRIGVVDLDHGPLAARYLAALRQAPGLSVETGSLAQERDQLAHDHVVALVILEPGFEAAGSGGVARVSLVLGNRTDQGSAVAADVVESVTSGFARALHLGGTQGIEIVRQSVSTAGQRTVDLLLPQMIAYLVLQSGVNYVAITLVDQRQRKVLRRFLATPLRPAQILAGNIVGGAATVFLQVLVLVALGLGAFHVRLHGSWWAATLLVVIGTACFVSIGFLLCSLARTSESARGLAAMVAFPMLFLSGVFIPIDLMPQSLQNAVHALPLTYLSEGLRAVLNDGRGIDRMVAVDLAVLTAWAAGCFALATLRFRWE